ncbi:uncharacterized protein LOC114121831 isoform X1 [Aphis gossypii]|nr:uncharacterized protein LOC114121831 isoform X1 [Aphis gossypii]
MKINHFFCRRKQNIFDIPHLFKSSLLDIHKNRRFTLSSRKSCYTVSEAFFVDINIYRFSVLWSVTFAMSTPRKSNLLVKNTGMSLNDRFTQIQKKSKPVVEDEIIRKHRILSFNMERRPEVAASLLMSQDFVNRERLRVPLPPPLPPPRTEINNRMYNSLMHDMIRSSDRVGIPVHERLTIGRPPLVEDRRRIRRRRGPKTKIREPVKPNVNTNGNSQRIPKVSKSKKRQNSKQRDQFPRKDQVISKEDLDQQLDQFMSHTKQKRDEELNRVIQENS